MLAVIIHASSVMEMDLRHVQFAQPIKLRLLLINVLIVLHLALHVKIYKHNVHLVSVEMLLFYPLIRVKINALIIFVRLGLGSTQSLIQMIV